jgi:hypothetical protein
MRNTKPIAVTYILSLANAYLTPIPPALTKDSSGEKTFSLSKSKGCDNSLRMIKKKTFQYGRRMRSDRELLKIVANSERLRLM